MKTLTPELRSKILRFQKTEITEYVVYNKLAEKEKEEENRQILQKIAEEEKNHSEIWKKYSGQAVLPSKLKVFKYLLVAKLLGLTFTLRLMEAGEDKAQHGYQAVINEFPETKIIFDQEKQHELALVALIKEEKLRHIGSIVLGLNDALVELTGALAGLTFALQDTKTVALAGLVTGIAASMSMAGSEYLSKKTEGDKHYMRAAISTGTTYIITVLLLVLPYLLFTDYRFALPGTLAIAVVIIYLFTYFASVITSESFARKFFEMALISFSVAGISFIVGIVLRGVFGVEV